MWQCVSLGSKLPLVSQRKCNQAIWKRVGERIFHETFPSEVWHSYSVDHFRGHWNFVENRSGMRMHCESLHLSVCDNKQGSSVWQQSCFFVHCRLSPCSNLGYLAVISLAHCYSRCCGCCWVGTFCSFLVWFCLHSHSHKHLLKWAE